MSTTRKKGSPRVIAAKKSGRGVEPRPRPEHSAAYEAALREYVEGLDLLRKRDFAGALQRFQTVQKGAAEEPELAERARTYGGLCQRRLAPPPAGPGTPEERYLLGVVRCNEGKADEAIALFDAALHGEPGSARILYARAVARALRADAAGAVSDLRQAIAADARLRHQAANDPDFEKIRDDAAFIDVIEPTPSEA